MNKDFFDSFEIEIACPQCGHHNPKTVGWIRGHDHLVCDSCEITFELDQKQFSDGFDRVQTATEDFRRLILRIGKA